MSKILIDEAAVTLVLEALEEIALAGMSVAPEMADSKEAFHARQAWRFIGIAARAMESVKKALAEQPAQQQEPPTNKYNDKRIAWELERTAMGDGYYGNALYVAMDMPQATAADKAMLHRYMHGSNTKTDHVKLQDLAMRVYTTPQAQPARDFVWLTLEEIKELKNLPGANRERTATEMAFAVRNKLMEKNT